MSAPKIILVHNHPSGDATPSKNDLKITKKIIKATELMGILLLDHVVVGDGLFCSILERISKDETF